MRRSLGDKRRYLTDDTIADLTCEHGAFQVTETCKIFDNADFGYRRITVERPLRLRFQIRCGLGLNQNLPFLDGHSS